MASASAAARLKELHRELDACARCPGMVGPVVHGPPVKSPVFLIGQAPGVHEGEIGRPFAWTAGKTLFRWFEQALGADEETVRRGVYMAAVARCFPGKDKKGSDRKPDAGEIDRCRTFLEREIQILRPELILPVGAMAIEQVLGEKLPLAEAVGTRRRARYHGVESDVIPLPHPSGASTWHVTEPGKTLLAKALRMVAEHPAVKATFR
ncbi:MAG TPA: uracil-DNA glycosylase family protein [Myxococcales bacterium]|nr:uracil-DNA glycosylase family protein [Myxococcales bacterium]